MAVFSLDSNFHGLVMDVIIIGFNSSSCQNCLASLRALIASKNRITKLFLRLPHNSRRYVEVFPKDGANRA